VGVTLLSDRASPILDEDAAGQRVYRPRHAAPPWYLRRLLGALRRLLGFAPAVLSSVLRRRPISTASSLRATERRVA